MTEQERRMEKPATKIHPYNLCELLNRLYHLSAEVNIHGEEDGMATINGVTYVANTTVPYRA